jgi:predicted signal transduction protein with EAL and GGDEF domain
MSVRISLDDFGTGYSSLSYPHVFRSIRRRSIARSSRVGSSLSLLHGVARLSAELDLAVAIEGVETREQLALIAGQHSITEVPGFSIGSAVPEQDADCCFRSFCKWTGWPRRPSKACRFSQRLLPAWRGVDDGLASRPALAQDQRGLRRNSSVTG